MRIAFVSDAVYPYLKGGIEVVRHIEMRELAKEHDVYSFSMRFDGMRQNARSEGITYISFGKTSQEDFYRHGRRSMRNALEYAFLLPFYLFRRRFDVVQVNAFPYLHLPAVKAYCMLTGCKMVIAEYEVWTESYWRDYLGSLGFLATPVNIFEKWSLRLGDFFTANSTVTFDKMVRERIPEDKIEVFSPVIDSAVIDRARAGQVRIENRVIFAGRLIKEKRLDLWLKAFRKVKNKVRSATGLIIGEGPEEQAIRNLISELGLNSSVSLRHFYRSKEELYREVRKSSVLLNMSEREGLSIIALEGIALGTPVILPSYSPVPDEVKGMCIVREEGKIPSAIIEIFRSKDRSKYVDGKEGLKPFMFSETGTVYSRIFSALGIER
jgi:glycosyltransferase involved in cell wall biosynthesis